MSSFLVWLLGPAVGAAPFLVYRFLKKHSSGEAYFRFAVFRAAWVLGCVALYSRLEQWFLRVHPELKDVAVRSREVFYRRMGLPQVRGQKPKAKIESKKPQRKAGK